MSDAVVFVERSRRRNNKYKCEEVTYRAKIDVEKLPENVRSISLSNIMDTVRCLFVHVIRRSTENLAPTDLIRFCIQAESLDKPISTSLMPVSSLTVEKLLAAITKVLQSKDKIELDAGFLLDVITVHRAVGAGRKIVNISTDRIRKKCIFVIPPDNEGLCCAKAIVYALAYLNGDTSSINAMRDQRRPNLINRARSLHEKAGVPLGPCTLLEIRQFEEYLDIQIAVFSSENLNKVCFILNYLINMYVF